MSEQNFDVEWGRLHEKLDHVADKVDKLDADVTELKGTVSKGWGIVIGAAGVLGLFAGGIVNSIKHILGLDGS